MGLAKSRDEIESGAAHNKLARAVARTKRNEMQGVLTGQDLWYEKQEGQETAAVYQDSHSANKVWTTEWTETTPG